MSAFVAIVGSGDRPPDARLLCRMTDSLAYSGPDGRRVWHRGPAGLGHALLRTTHESEHDHQPATLDGAVWIVADARVDARPALIEELHCRGCSVSSDAPDAHLILHAYRAWGDTCVDHLLGDFTFVIWDAPRQRVFSARDHFGIKPFYYAPVDGGYVFSNTLDCVRMHPCVSSDLNELAIADFLVFGCNQDAATTTFAQIRRLPPAHCLVCERGTVRSRRYWALPTDGEIRYRRSHDYVDHFREIFRTAVADRLRFRRIGVSMSGGLDSTSIAATARQISARQDPPTQLRAHTIVYDSLVADDERPYAQQAADAAGVPVDFFAADEYEPFQGWDGEVRMPEPSDDVFLLMRTQQLERARQHSPVLLCGEGGDEVLWASDLVDVVPGMSPGELVGGIVRAMIACRRRPGLGIRSRVNKWIGRDRSASPFPPWLDNAFAKRTGLRARWMTQAAVDVPCEHPLRPEACRRLAGAQWAAYFERLDPGATGVPIDVRYPFLDVRLVTYLLAVPPLPWCVDKQLLRAAMVDLLPEPVRLRRKTPLAEDPLMVHLRRRSSEPLWRIRPHPELRRFVDVARVPDPEVIRGDVEGVELHLRPRCLEYWLSCVRPHAPSSKRSEIYDERGAGSSAAAAGQRALPAAPARSLR